MSVATDSVATESAATAPRGRWSRLLDPSPRLCWAILVVAWVLATALLLWLHRGLTMAVDEYGFSETFGAGSAEEFLIPRNGHLTVLPFLIFKLLYVFFGTTLAPFIVVEGAMLALLSAGLYVFSRSRIGPLLALAPALLPLFLGTAWPLLMPPMIGLLWIVCMAAGLWALLLVERGTVRGDVGACVLLLIALASFALSFVFVAACAVAILVSHGRWRRIYVVVVPVLLWGAWYIWSRKFGSLGAHPTYLWLTPAYGVDSIAANGAAIFGQTLTYGPATSLKLEGFSLFHLALAIAFALIEVVVCLAVVRRVGFRALNRPTLWIVLVIPLVWWASEVVVLAEFRGPAANRYFLAGVVILLLVGVEVARGMKVTPLRAATVFTLLAVAVVSNLVAFSAGRSTLHTFSREAKAIEAMVELEGRKGDQAYNVSAEPLTYQSQFIYLTAGPYLDIAERYGYRGDTVGEVEAAPGEARRAADLVSARLLFLELTPVQRRSKRGCRRAGAVAGAHRVVVSLPRGGATFISAKPRVLHLGRFSNGFPVELGKLGGRPEELRIPTDPARRPWRAVARGAAPLLACPLPG